eukprot:g13896.t1
MNHESDKSKAATASRAPRQLLALAALLAAVAGGLHMTKREAPGVHEVASVLPVELSESAESTEIPVSPLPAQEAAPEMIAVGPSGVLGFSGQRKPRHRF